MRQEYKEKLEKGYGAYKARRNDRIIVKALLLLVVTYVSFYILRDVSNNLVPQVYKTVGLAFIFSFSFVIIFRYWWMDPIETGLFLDFYKAYERLEFYFEDKEKFHLNRAESHIRDALIKMSELLSRRTRSVFYREAAEPLKELYRGILKKIIPLDSKRENLAQIREKIGELAVIFLDINLEKIIKFNKTLESVPVFPKESLFTKVRNRLMRSGPIVLFIGSFVFIFAFIIVAIGIFSYILGADIIQTLRNGVVQIVNIVASLVTAILQFYSKKILRAPVKKT